MSELPALPIFPHLGMTESELEKICEEIWSMDTVLEKHKQRIVDQQTNMLDYEQRTRVFTEQLRKVEGEEDELKARLKNLDTQRRELHGAIQGVKYHHEMSKRRIRECETAITKRKKQLYLLEARRRLGRMGKELRLGVGRRLQKGLGTAVIDV